MLLAAGPTEEFAIDVRRVITPPAQWFVPRSNAPDRDVPRRVSRRVTVPGGRQKTASFPATNSLDSTKPGRARLRFFRGKSLTAWQ